MDPGDPLDAGWDVDFDGFTTLEEYRLGTSPVERGSSFRIFSSFSITGAQRTLILRWLSRPGNRYQVEEFSFRGPELGFDWVRLLEIEGPEAIAVTSVEIDLPVSPEPGRNGSLYRVSLLESSVSLRE